MNTTPRTTQATKTEEIFCLDCRKALKPLGLVSVACNCKSFSIGLNGINETGKDGRMVFGSWPVTMADVLAIHQTRCFNCDHAGVR